MSDPDRGTWLRHMLEQQPAFIVSALYLFASIVGLVYSWAFLRPFGIDVLQYSEIGDFLLASLKEPTIWFLVLSALLLVQTDSAMSRRVERRGASRWMRWYGTANYRRVNYVISVLMVFTFLFVFADLRSERVRDGAGDDVRLELADGSAPQQRVLLGTTVNYIFVYDRESGRAFVHPGENVLSISRRVGATSEDSVAASEEDRREGDADQADDGAGDGTLEQGDAESEQ